MRILFVSAFYPPHVIGGWEQLVQDINVRLKARGHTTHVLTSNYDCEESNPGEDGVSRILSLESNNIHYKPVEFLTKRQNRHKRNLESLKKTIDLFRPDIIFIHGMWNLWRGIPWQAEHLMPGKVVYYIADNWPYSNDPHIRYWKDPARRVFLRYPKRLLGYFAIKSLLREAQAYSLKFENALCVSQAIKNDLAHNVGIPLDYMQVVYNGIEIDQFIPSQAKNRGEKKLSLLYSGSLILTKGVHTAIEAMNILVNESLLSDVNLTIVGAGNPDYEARLREMVDQYHLHERVHFWGRVPREEMPELMQRFDILLLPSIWDPLPRVVIEAMGSGLVVVGTLAGGTQEILIEGETGLTFEPGDAKTLARRIQELSDHPELRAKLTQNARNLVVRQHDLQSMILEVEKYLKDVSEMPVLLV